MSSCFQIIRFLEWWPEKGAVSGGRGRGYSSRGKRRASNRGRGVLGSDPAFGPVAAAVKEDQATDARLTGIAGSSAVPAPSNLQVGLPSLSPEQWSNLLDLLNAPKNKHLLHL